MQTEIHSSDFELTTSLTTFIRRQTDRSMGAFYFYRRWEYFV